MYITEPHDTTAFPQLSYSENQQRGLDWLGNQSFISNKYKLKRKEKNKSREEIFYQMKVFFF